MNNEASKVIEFPEYLNLKSAFREESDAFNNSIENETARSLMEMGRRHARSKIAYDVEFFKWYGVLLDAQKKRLSTRVAHEVAEQVLLRIAYTAIGEAKFNRRCNECKGRVIMQMRDLIPVPYAVFGAVSLLFTVVFGTLFGVFLFTPYTIMNPWVNLVYLIGSFGMFMTVIAAIKERKAGKL